MTPLRMLLTMWRKNRSSGATGLGATAVRIGAGGVPGARTSGCLVMSGTSVVA